jgi:hypothetical protein
MQITVTLFAPPLIPLYSVHLLLPGGGGCARMFVLLFNHTMTSASNISHAFVTTKLFYLEANLNYILINCECNSGQLRAGDGHIGNGSPPL